MSIKQQDVVFFALMTSICAGITGLAIGWGEPVSIAVAALTTAAFLTITAISCREMARELRRLQSRYFDLKEKVAREADVVGFYGMRVCRKCGDKRCPGALSHKAADCVR